MIVTHHKRRLGALADWAAQLLVLVGLPIALWRCTGNPILTGFPSWPDVQDWWAGVQLHPASALYIVPRLVVDALWIAWAWYAAWTVVGLVWELLRLPGILLPRILLRLTPRTTVRAITVGAVAATPVAHTAPAPHHATALPADLTGLLHLAGTPISSPRASHPTTARPVPPRMRVHHVIHGDTLWDLAKQYYGDGEAWRRIYAANAGHRQADGRALSDPDLILPGWTLTLPGPTVTTDPALTAPAPNPDALPTTPPAPSGTHAPATAPSRATTPGAPTPATPEPTRGGTTGQPPPAAHPCAPRTVGYRPPDGGYIGITLLAALAACVALLKTRRRLRHDADAPIPPIAETLAAAHDAAKAADTYGYLPDEHPDQTPPPLYQPEDGMPAFGISPDEAGENWYTPAALSGPLVYQGERAADAVRAFALAVLTANPPGCQPCAHQLIIDRNLAAELLGATPGQQIPGLLQITDTPDAAVTAYQIAAEHHALEHADSDTGDNPPTLQNSFITLLLRADVRLHPAITRAQRTDPARSLGAVLLGPLTIPDEHTTIITVDQDATIIHAAGPDAQQLYGLIAQHLPRQTAADLFRTLYTSRTHPHPDPDITPDTAPAPAPAITTAPPTTTTTTVSAPLNALIASQNTARISELTSTGPNRITHPAAPVTTPSDPRSLTTTPLLLRILGPLDILGPNGPIPVAGDRTAALTALLALHPKGLTTDELAELAWDTPPARRDGASPVHTALTRARTAFRNALNPEAASGQGRYIIKDAARRFHLDPQLITTDLALLDKLEAQAQQTADPSERRKLLRSAVDLYRGPLADTLGENAHEWLATARHQTTTRIARLHLTLADLADDNPADAFAHLAAATRLATGDPHITATAIRSYRSHGHNDLAQATYRNHEHELATLGISPDPYVTRLATTSIAEPSAEDPPPVTKP